MLTELISAQSSATAGAKPPEDAARRLDKLHHACTDFEALLVQQMFDAMEKTLQEGNLVGSGLSGSVYSGFLSEAVAKTMAGTHTLGVSESLYKDTLKHEPDLKRFADEQVAAGKKAFVPSEPLSPLRAPQALTIGGADKPLLEMAKPDKLPLTMPQPEKTTEASAKDDKCQGIPPWRRYP